MGLANNSHSTAPIVLMELPIESEKDSIPRTTLMADQHLPPVMTIALVPTITTRSCKKPHYSYTAEWVNRDVESEPRFQDSRTGNIRSDLDDEFKRVSTYVLRGLNDFLSHRTDMSHPIREDWIGWATQALQDSEAFRQFTQAVLPTVQSTVNRDFYRKLNIHVTSNTIPATVVRKDQGSAEPKCLADTMKWVGVLFAPSWKVRVTRLGNLVFGETVPESTSLQAFWDETHDRAVNELEFCTCECC